MDITSNQEPPSVMLATRKSVPEPTLSLRPRSRPLNDYVSSSCLMDNVHDSSNDDVMTGCNNYNYYDDDNEQRLYGVSFVADVSSSKPTLLLLWRMVFLTSPLQS